MPSDVELDEIYRSSYSDEAIEAAATNQETPKEFLDQYARYVDSLAPTAKSILDFGSGTGHMVLALRKLGRRVQGLEYSSAARAFALKEFGLSLAKDLDALEGTKFDLVTMIEVIEHLIDPRSVLAALKNLLEPTGKILISTPNSASLKARLRASRWSEAEKTFHLHLFKPSTLAKLLEAAGYTQPRQLFDYPMVRASLGARIVHRGLGQVGAASRLFMIANAGAK